MATDLRQWCETCETATESWVDVDGRVYCGGCEPPEKVHGDCEGCYATGYCVCNRLSEFADAMPDLRVCTATTQERQ